MLGLDAKATESKNDAVQQVSTPIPEVPDDAS